MRRGSSFLGCDVAIMGGAMTWVSERHLVAAISNAGGFGVLACGSMEPNRLTEEIGATRSLTDRPFGVNLILLHPALEALIDRCCDAGVGYIVLAGGLPNRAILERCKKNGAKVMAFAPTASAAKRLIRNGADGLIIEGAEAGGHIGPVATSVLAQEILPEIDEVPVFVAGGIGHGEAIAGYLSMGAAGVQLGTRFVSATECVAHPRFKETFIRAQARDAMPTVQLDPEFKVIPVRALVNQGTDAFHAKQREVIGQFRSGEMDYQTASLAIEHFWAGALRRAVIDGDVETGSLMAGQSVGFVKKEQPVREIIEELVAQTETALTRSAKP
ncbi:MAG: NAD(P)H-dependent flavin oxidoreductase [Geminicoccaceae bacterium]